MKRPLLVLLILLLISSISGVVGTFWLATRVQTCKPMWTASMPSTSITGLSIEASYHGDYFAAGWTPSSGGFSDFALFSRNSSQPVWQTAHTYGYGYAGLFRHWVSMSQSGEYVAAGAPFGPVQLFSRSGNTPLWNFTPYPPHEQSAPPTVPSEIRSAVSGNGAYLAVLTHRPIKTSDTVYLLSTASNVPLWSYDVSYSSQAYSHVSPPGQAIALSHEGQYVATSFNGILYFFSSRNNETVWRFDFGEKIPARRSYTNVLMSATGDYIVSHHNNSLLVFDRQSNFMARTISLDPGRLVHLADFSSDGSTIAVILGPNPESSWYDQVILYDRASGKEVFRASPKPGGGIWSAQLSDSGGLLAVGGDASVFIYERGGRLICSASGEFGTERVGPSIAVSGDGRIVASGGNPFSLFEISQQSPSPLLFVPAAVSASAAIVAGVVVLYRRKRNTSAPKRGL